MDIGLANQTVLVTGAGSGIGKGIALGLARYGAAIVAADVVADSARATAEEITAAGGHARWCQLDVANLDQCHEVALACRKAGPVSAIVNNAGVSRRGTIDDADARDAWDDCLAVNATGGFNMVLAFLPQLRETRGNIVNIASISGVVASRTFPGYNASKAAMIGLTKSLSQKLAPEGIRVNAILPGAIDTPMTERLRSNPEAVSYFMGRTPLGRFGRPEDFAGPVAFLISDMSAFVTGATLAVDGGLLAE